MGQTSCVQVFSHEQIVRKTQQAGSNLPFNFFCYANHTRNLADIKWAAQFCLLSELLVKRAGVKPAVQMYILQHPHLNSRGAGKWFLGVLANTSEMKH
jgi:hypothetical protein